MIETLRNAWKVPELRTKILYTLLIIVVYRLGAHLPVPFMDAGALREMVDTTGSMLGFLNNLTGGAFANATLFAMGISPYITSSIVIQLLTVAIPALERMSKEGEAGRKKITQITRYTTLGLALIQSIAYYILNRNMGALMYRDGFAGTFTAVVIVLSFTAGALLIVWLGESIDRKGMGNGISIILFAGIISRGPDLIRSFWIYWNMALEGETQYFIIMPLIVILFLAMIAAIVLMTNAERRIPIQYAKRVVGRKMYGGQSSYIPVKVTMSGVMPVIFASALLSIPGMIRGFIDPGKTRFLNPEGGFNIIGHLFNAFEYTSPFYAIFYLLLIIGFNYFYVAIQYNPVQMANDLRKNSGTIPGIRPGKPTSEFISKVIGKITLVGALFIAAVAVLPILLGSVAKINIALGGTSLIIVVGVALDTVRQLESQMMMRHYKGFLE